MTQESQRKWDIVEIQLLLKLVDFNKVMQYPCTIYIK